MDSHTVFPDVVLLEIFSYLSVGDLLQSRIVCKHWKRIIQIDSLWKRILQRWKELWSKMELINENSEDLSAFKTVLRIWNSRSVKNIGKERWYPLPFQKFWREYEDRFHWQRERDQVTYLNHGGPPSTQMYLRLNPIHQFTTTDEHTGDDEMKRACEQLRVHFGHFECVVQYSLVRWPWEGFNWEETRIYTNHEIMTDILAVVEDYLEGIHLRYGPYRLDEDYNIIPYDGHREPNYDEEEWPPERRWNPADYKRLLEHHWQDIRRVFANQSENFMNCRVRAACFNVNDFEEHLLYVSDTAAYHVVKYHDSICYESLNREKIDPCEYCHSTSVG